MWTVIEREGPASELFDPTWFDAYDDRRTIVHLRPIGSAVVLGSSQNEFVVDGAAAAGSGVAVVRRRSGGGAVWLDGSLEWIDIVLPAGDPLVEADVHRAFYWLGDAFGESLVATTAADVADAADASAPQVGVHHGSLARAPLNKLICFAGLGAGEVTLGGRKVIGISQRRTRRYTLFQCGVLRAWDPRPLVELLRPGLVAAGLVGPGIGVVSDIVSSIADHCVGLGDDAAPVVADVVARLREATSLPVSFTS